MIADRGDTGWGNHDIARSIERKTCRCRKLGAALTIPITVSTVFTQTV